MRIVSAIEATTFIKSTVLKFNNVSTQSHLHFIATEYGVINLFW